MNEGRSIKGLNALRRASEELLVAATDLNVSLTAELKSHNATDGGITLGAKNLYELIAKVDFDVDFDVDMDARPRRCTAT